MYCKQNHWFCQDDCPCVLTVRSAPNSRSTESGYDTTTNITVLGLFVQTHQLERIGRQVSDGLGQRIVRERHGR